MKHQHTTSTHSATASAKRQFVLVWMVLLTLAVCGSAQAVIISVSDIELTDLIGNTEWFTWSVTAGSDQSFSIDTGENHIFTYGTFSTTDFPVLWDWEFDVMDNDDSFTVNFDLMPPEPPEHISQVGHPDASLEWFTEYVQVNFDNTWTTIEFGTGGEYRIRFLDSTNLYANGTVDLQAEIQVMSGSSGPTATSTSPEPSSVILLSLAILLGFGFARRRKSRT